MSMRVRGVWYLLAENSDCSRRADECFYLQCTRVYSERERVGVVLAATLIAHLQACYNEPWHGRTGRIKYSTEPFIGKHTRTTRKTVRFNFGHAFHIHTAHTYPHLPHQTAWSISQRDREEHCLPLHSPPPTHPFSILTNNLSPILASGIWVRERNSVIASKFD